jgi:hypothetical protein
MTIKPSIALVNVGDVGYAAPIALRLLWMRRQRANCSQRHRDMAGIHLCPNTTRDEDNDPSRVRLTRDDLAPGRTMAHR